MKISAQEPAKSTRPLQQRQGGRKLQKKKKLLEGKCCGAMAANYLGSALH